MRILVTGATGFIGSHAVASLLRAGHTVRVFVRDPAKLGRVLGPLDLREQDVEVAIGEVGDSNSIASALENCQGLLHCAGIFSPERQDETRLIATNVEGTRTVLGVAATANLERVVYVSSMLALFPPSGDTMTAEDDVARPSTMYAKTKADAERIARSFQPSDQALEARPVAANQEGGTGHRPGQPDDQEMMPLTIVYPSSVHGPHDPTFSIGPQLVAEALDSGSVLVTEGGLATTDVRDLAAMVARIFDGGTSERRLMAPSFYVRHDHYHALLESLTGRSLAAKRIPGWLLRVFGRFGDVAQRLGRNVQLTYEAAEVLTRSVPVDDTEARRLLGGEPITDEDSFRDLIAWMVEVGHLDAESAGDVVRTTGQG